MNFSVLNDYGIDWRRGITRCMGDAELYERLLILFLQDETLAKGRKALAKGDYTELFELMHELKGASGNAELTELFKATGPLVELLRGGEAEASEVARLFDAVSAAYVKATEGILLADG